MHFTYIRNSFVEHREVDNKNISAIMLDSKVENKQKLRMVVF